MTYFLPRVVGPGKALELALNDPNLDAKSALEAGLVTEVVPATSCSSAPGRRPRSWRPRLPTTCA